MNGQPQRLDSWKEIADYLDRDVRTAMRWAKSHGLPVRRIAGRGRSVFAFAHEIDDWLAGQPETGSPEIATPPAAAPAPAPAAARHSRRFAIAALLLCGVAGAAFWLAWRTPPAGPALRVEMTPAGVTLSDARGGSRALLRFDPALSVVLPRQPASRILDVDADGVPDVLVGVSYFDNTNDRTVRSGELLNLSTFGDVRWKFIFDDALAFQQERFAGPWAITDWQAGPAASPSRIAIAAHHAMWWASMAAVLDHTGRRLGTFVNPGWLESLLWIDRDRLAVAGFSNARDAAMLAIVDATRPDSQAPGTGGTQYACTSCTGGAPLFYATFPRSELNVLTGSRFNRAQAAWLDGRLVITTIEIPGDSLAATAHYEFDENLRLVRAQYDDAYWDAHRRLEREGRLAHGRETCPQQNGPPAIEVWDAGEGWVRVAAGG